MALMSSEEMYFSWALSAPNSGPVKSVGCWDDTLDIGKHSLQEDETWKHKLTGTSHEAVDMVEHLDRKLLPVECMGWGMI